MAGLRLDFRAEDMDRFRARLGEALQNHRPDDIERALQLALELQVRLFPLPAGEFLALGPADQFERLGRGLSADTARDTGELYVELLFYTGTLYDLQERVELATGARQLALHLALLSAMHHGSELAARLVAPLRQLLPDDRLSAPVQELLAKVDQPGGAR